jgi:NTP pyrophosphatase (non-canonical NTP hydrolase)
MELNTYQSEAMRTAVYPVDRGLEYATLGLASEAGEVAGKVKKVIRDKDGIYTEADRKEIASEAADVLWYLAAIARELGTTLEVMAQGNLNKLESRARRGVIGGNGDNR